MEITEIKVFLKDDRKLKAYVNVVFDNCFIIRGLKVIDGSRGHFVSMPSRKKADGSFADVAHPINNEIRIMIEEKVLDAYERELKE